MAKREPDPETQLAQLDSELGKSEGLRRGYLLKGDERYFVERGITSILAKGKALGLDISRHDAEDPDFVLSSLLDDLAGSPMFATGRLVVVRAAAKALVGGKDAPLARAAVAWLGDSSQIGSLVLAGPSLRADNVVSKAIVKSDGLVLGCRKLWDTPSPWSPDPRRVELVLWLQRRAQELGVRLDSDRAMYMTSATGNDLYALEGELKKLKTSGGMAVTDVVEFRGSASPWVVAEDLCRGDFAKSVEGVANLFRGGFRGKDGKRLLDVNGLVAILLSGLRKSVTEGERAAREMARGANLQAAGKAAGVPGSPMAKKGFEERMATRPPGDWERMSREVLVLERKTRSGTVVDENDFLKLALAWRAKRRRR